LIFPWPGYIGIVGEHVRRAKNTSDTQHPVMSLRSTSREFPCGATLVVAFLLSATSFALTPSPENKTPGSAGFVIELAAQEADVLQAVKSVAEDPIIRGTYIYDKEQTLTGATPAESSAYFGRSKESGHVFYKVLTGAVAPRHFKDSNDRGTITIQYVVQGNGARTRLRIDAVFVQEGRHHAHASDGTVETSEFEEIQDRLGKIRLTEQHAAEILARQQEELMKATSVREWQGEQAKLDGAKSSVRTLEQRVDSLRHDVELRTKDEGAELKSAPFHSSAKLRSLSAGTEVLILVITPYWYGVETKDAQRGWLRRDQLVPLP
jgi:hypothetical protein